MQTNDQIKEEWEEESAKWSKSIDDDRSLEEVAFDFFLSKRTTELQEMVKHIQGMKDLFPWPSNEENIHHFGRDEYIARIARNSILDKVINYLQGKI